MTERERIGPLSFREQSTPPPEKPGSHGQGRADDRNVQQRRYGPRARMGHIRLPDAGAGVREHGCLNPCQFACRDCVPQLPCRDRSVQMIRKTNSLEMLAQVLAQMAIQEAPQEKLPPVAADIRTIPGPEKALWLLILICWLNNSRLARWFRLARSIQPMLWGQGSSRSEERRVGKECRSRWSPY